MSLMGTTMSDWKVSEIDGSRERNVETRAEAEEVAEDMRQLGMDVEIVTDDTDTATDGGNPDMDVDVVDHAPDKTGEQAVEETPAPDNHAPEYDLPERNVSDDPLTWMPGEFVDTIDGSQAINRRGFEVLSHFYGVSTTSDVQVAPEETDHEYARVKATAETEDGRTVEAHGSAHLDRGDDAYLLLEMADTRARKRALSIATGVGAVAVEELKNEVDA